MINDKKYLTSTYLLKFNNAQIKLHSNSIVLTKENYIKGILLITDYTIDFTKFKKITRKKLLSQK